jgi:hypothetical protein
MKTINKAVEHKHEDWAAMVAGWSPPKGRALTRGCQAIKEFVAKHKRPMSILELRAAMGWTSDGGGNIQRFIRAGVLERACVGYYIPGPNA